MKLSSSTLISTSHLIALVGLINLHQRIVVVLANVDPDATTQLQQSTSGGGIQARLIDRCCQVGKERAIESPKFNCKLSTREALITTGGSSNQHRTGGSLLALTAENLLARDPTFADHCEMVLESCCMSHHRTKNCDSGKQFAKSGAACMDVELSKEATIATESFNDCCMSCSLGILAAKNPSQNETTIGNWLTNAGGRQVGSNLNHRCKLISPLASSLSGQLYEQTYIECCQENLPRVSGALVEPGSPVDCAQSNPCSQKCVPASTEVASFELDGTRSGGYGEQDRCDCFAGYKLASDGINCIDIDECKLGLHTCNKHSEVCDNTRGSFRCLARHRSSLPHISVSGNNNNNDDAIDHQGLTSAGDFSSLRLCPLGQRWNSEENRCQSPQDNHHSHSHSHHHHQHQHHHQSSSNQRVVTSSSTGLHLLASRLRA